MKKIFILSIAAPTEDSKETNTTPGPGELSSRELPANSSYDDDAYTGGEIYDPKSGKTYAFRIKLGIHNFLS